MTDEPLTLRPSMRTEAVRFGTSTLAYAIFIVPFLIWLVVGRSDPQPSQRTARVATLAGGLIVLAIVNAIVLLMARANRAIFVDATSVGEVSWLGKRVRYPRERVSEIRRLSVGHKTTDPVNHLLVLDGADHRLLDLRAA